MLLRQHNGPVGPRPPQGHLRRPTYLAPLQIPIGVRRPSSVRPLFSSEKGEIRRVLLRDRSGQKKWTILVPICLGP